MSDPQNLFILGLEICILWPLRSTSPLFLLQLLVTTILFSVSMNLTFWGDSTFKQYHTVYVFLCLVYFIGIMPSSFIHVVTNGRIPPLLQLNNIPLCIYICIYYTRIYNTFSLPNHQSTDTHAVSIAWLMHITMWDDGYVN